MITNVYTIEKLKSLIAELFYNKTTKVTAASDESVINAIFFGTAKVGQKAMKDIALVESHLFPQYAYGANLDNAAALFGAPIRNTSAGSSTFVLLRATIGTEYISSTNIFSGENGISFELTEDFTMTVDEYAYVKVRSMSVGAVTNVHANTILKVTPVPIGHIGVTNEYMATGGRDDESDDDFRLRIIQHPNIIAQKTLVYLTEVFRLRNENVLRVLNMGVDNDAKQNLAIVLQNGQDLTETELADLLSYSQGYMAIGDMSMTGDVAGIKLINPTWYAIGGDTTGDRGIDFRIQMYDDYDPVEVRKNIQIALSNHIDYRFWDWSQLIQWTDLIGIVKAIPGVRYVPDYYFYPQTDITVPVGQLPRMKKFVMRDLTGNVLFENNALISIFYPLS